LDFRLALQLMPAQKEDRVQRQGPATWYRHTYGRIQEQRHYTYDLQLAVQMLIACLLFNGLLRSSYKSSCMAWSCGMLPSSPLRRAMRGLKLCIQSVPMFAWAML